MGYNKESKKFYIKIYTKILAYELYLDIKYHSDQNNSDEILLNECLNKGWILSDKEKELLLKIVIKIAKVKYHFK